MSNFVHLRLHTQYSVLDGANKISPLISQAKSLGQEAVGMTDHGNMHGAVEFFDACVSEEIKPIVGCEVYVSSTSRVDKRPKSQGGPESHHLTLLAMDYSGYQNLCKLVSLGYLEGFYHRPRIDDELLREFNQGIICLSGCLSSRMGSFALSDNYEAAKRHLQDYSNIFNGRFYLEVQPHAISEQRKLNSLCLDLGREVGVPLVATNDCHYLDKEDHYAQEVLMCVSTGKLITDPDRMRHEGLSLHFKSEEEMLGELPSYESAIKESSEIARRCNLQFNFSTYHMPRFDPPQGDQIEDYFEAEVRRGLELRFNQLEDRGRKLDEESKQVYLERIDEEIELIHQMGFGGYFLVVSDFVRWAKHESIPVGPGRGSAAGSLVAYALEITEVDPIEYKLLFERFLNPERISLPDIDIDFCINGRDRVIEYVTQKYGKDKVAQIVTFGTLKAKQAIKDVGRVLGLSYAETDRIAKLIPAPRQGFDYPLAEALKMEKRLKEYAEGEGEELIQLALKLEGLSRHTSTHAAGLVIADKPIVEYMPLMTDKDDQVVSQFSMGYVEKIGLVKFDFLGLKTLSVIKEVCRQIEQDYGEKIDLDNLPLDDQKTYRLVSSGRTIGVFQLESSGITEMISRLKPNCFEDLVAILALYRPGPLDAGMVDHYINRKHGKESVRSIHPILEPILKDTYAIILYQEQIMRIARDMAGYSLGEADMLRRAMGKKKPEEMAKQRVKFEAGAKERGVPAKIASEVFDQMETFARYGFNRSHSVAYALVSFQTAYLKAHYPRQFMAALMTFEMGDTDKTLKNLTECREMKLGILPPDLNSGQTGFNVSGNKIRFALAAIKGVGEKAVELLISARNAGGEFKSLLDFCRRVDKSLLNRRALENFVKAGAFDWTGLSRAELTTRLDDVIRVASRLKEEESSGQLGLFSSQEMEQAESYQPNRELLPEWPMTVKLANEREALGFYLSGHPLEKFRSELERLGTLQLGQINLQHDGNKITTAGVITLLKLKNTKKGDRYASFVLEDLSGTNEVIVWPDVYQKVHEILQSEDPVIVHAKVDISEERRTLIAQHVESAIDLRDRKARQAVICVESKLCSGQRLSVLKEVLAKHQGQCPVKFVVRDNAKSDVVINLPGNVAVEPSEELSNCVEQIFGSPVLSFRT